MSDDEIVDVEKSEQPDSLTSSNRNPKPRMSIAQKLRMGYYLVRAWFKESTDRSLAALSVLIMGLGLVLGLLDLVVALILIAAVLGYLVHTSSLSTFVKEALHCVLFFMLFSLATIYAAPEPNNNLPQFAVPRFDAISTQQERILRSINTENFWNRTIVARHMTRFGPPDQVNLKNLEAMRRFHDQQLADIQRVREIAQNSKNVALDLKDLSLRLIAMDEREMEWMMRGVDFIGENNRPLKQQSLAEALSHLDEMTDEQWAQLPAEQQQLIVEFFELVDAKQPLLSDVLTMQERLCERYPTRKFPLPDIFENMQQ
ncbi:hypothetical protein GC197_07760 [bacterium]|nr:hypothetical protein [bacterium]